MFTGGTTAGIYRKYPMAEKRQSIGLICHNHGCREFVLKIRSSFICKQTIIIVDLTIS